MLERFQDWRWKVPNGENSTVAVELFFHGGGREEIRVNGVLQHSNFSWSLRSERRLPVALPDGRAAELVIRFGPKKLPTVALELKGEVIQHHFGPAPEDYEDALKTRNWVWPKIDDLSSAEAAADLGMWAAVAVTVLTTGAVFIGFIHFLGLIDACIFSLLAAAIHFRYRWASEGAIVVFILERIMMGNYSMLSTFIILALINGARGVHAIHRYQAEEAAKGEPAKRAA